MKRIIAIYKDQTRAAQAARALESHGIDEERISMLTADSASGQLFMTTERSSAKKSALAGAAVGSTGGLVAASLLGAGALFFGPIGIALTGTIAGGLLGGLIGLGIPENEAELRGREIVDGAILVAIDLSDEDPAVEKQAIDTLGATDYLHIVELDEPAIASESHE